ncbi:MAG: NUDIX domain-containing protein [Pseudomonadales bacterium]|nr:NUDIX domain-containing protein [Pseudomonadales bacterium]
MHRRKLLDLISEYAASHPGEDETVDRFVAFVSRETRCFERDCWSDGHITGSAWVVDPERTSVLLTHHKKLNIWVQLGGHSDGDPDTPAVADREAREESGLAVDFLERRIFDLDVHLIPERKGDPAHFHYDVRFAFGAKSKDYVVSEESNDLRWVPICDLPEYSSEESLLRMQRKWLR